MIEKKLDNNTYLLVLEVGEILPDKLMEFVKKNNIKSACILNGIGMLDNIEMGYFNGKEYEKEEVKEAKELLSMQGNLTYKEGNPMWHIHCMFGERGGNAIGGHLFSGRVCVTAEIFIKAFDTEIIRKQKMPGLFLINE